LSVIFYPLPVALLAFVTLDSSLRDRGLYIGQLLPISHLQPNLVEVLRNHLPLQVNPEDYVFTTPRGTPIDEENFYRREWLPVLRRSPEVRPRPFYNTRHSYTSFLFSIGAKPAFVSAQTGDSIRTLEKYYAKYIPEADSGRELVERTILNSETLVQPEAREKLVANAHTPPTKKKAPELSGA